MTRRVAIVGAGITGLAAAYYLEKRARAASCPLSVHIIETSQQPGGKIVTRREGDFVLEGGPDSFITDKPWALELCHELGLAGDLIPSNPHDNKIYVLQRSQLVPFPAGFRLAIPTRLWPLITTPLISWTGKLRMAMEYVLPPRMDDSDESVGLFIERRFGREAVELFGGPLMAGIYMSDPDKLSMRGTFPAFLEMEKKYGSLIRAARAMKKLSRPPRAGPAPAGQAMFNSLKGGMYQLVEALRENISAEWHLGSTVQSLCRVGPSWLLELNNGAVQADDVIVALPANRSAALIAPHHEKLAAALAAIRFVSTATISLAYLREDLPSGRPLDGYGVVMPAGEKCRIVACTWTSTKFKHRAPPDAVLLRAFVGGYRNEAIADEPDQALVEMVRDEFAKLFGITAAPVLSSITRWPAGNPQYEVGHLDRVAAMEQMAGELRGIHLAGSSYHGVGLPDCIKSAIRAVERIMPCDARTRP